MIEERFLILATKKIATSRASNRLFFKTRFFHPLFMVKFSLMKNKISQNYGAAYKHLFHQKIAIFIKTLSLYKKSKIQVETMPFFLKIKKSLKVKTTLIIVFVLLIGIGVSSGINMIKVKNKIKEALQREIYASGLLVRNTIEVNLEYFSLENLSGMSEFFHSILESNKKLSHLFVSDIHHNILYYTDYQSAHDSLNRPIHNPSESFSSEWDITECENYYETILPLFVLKGKRREVIGYIHLGVEKKIIDQEVFDLIVSNLAVFISSLIVSIILLLFFISRKVTHPISTLSLEMKSIRKNMSFKRKLLIKGEDEVGELGKSFNSMLEEIEKYSDHLEELVTLRTENLNAANRELKKNSDQIQKELKMAQRIQLAIIPNQKTFPKTKEMNFGGQYSALEDVGGDLYDILRVGKNAYGFLMADVSGHGVPAALVTTMAKVSFYTNTSWNKTTGETCAGVNQEIYNFIGDLEHYLTAYYCVFNLETGILSYTNAGHHPAILFNPETKKTVTLDTKDFFIGCLKNVEYKTREIKVEKNDRLLLFTDGIVEARNGKRQSYGYERLMKCIDQFGGLPPSDFTAKITEDVLLFEDGHPTHDDKAVLCIEFLEPLLLEKTE